MAIPDPQEYRRKDYKFLAPCESVINKEQSIVTDKFDWNSSYQFGGKKKKKKKGKKKKKKQKKKKLPKPPEFNDDTY